MESAVSVLYFDHGLMDATHQNSWMLQMRVVNLSAWLQFARLQIAKVPSFFLVMSFWPDINFSPLTSSLNQSSSDIRSYLIATAKTNMAAPMSVWVNCRERKKQPPTFTPKARPANPRQSGAGGSTPDMSGGRGCTIRPWAAWFWLPFRLLLLNS